MAINWEALSLKTSWVPFGSNSPSSSPTVLGSCLNICISPKEYSVSHLTSGFTKNMKDRIKKRLKNPYFRKGWYFFSRSIHPSSATMVSVTVSFVVSKGMLTMSIWSPLDLSKFTARLTMFSNFCISSGVRATYCHSTSCPFFSIRL